MLDNLHKKLILLLITIRLSMQLIAYNNREHKLIQTPRLIKALTVALKELSLVLRYNQLTFKTTLKSITFPFLCKLSTYTTNQSSCSISDLIDSSTRTDFNFFTLKINNHRTKSRSYVENDFLNKLGVVDDIKCSK